MKKFLQKSSAWLVMLVAMFAMSTAAMAQDAEFNVVGKSNTTQTDKVNGVTWTCHLSAWAGGANFYSYSGDTFVVDAPEGKVITQIKMTLCDTSNCGGTATVNAFGEMVGELTYADGYATWEGESDYVEYTRTGSRDWSFNHVAVWLADAADATMRTNFNFNNSSLQVVRGGSNITLNSGNDTAAGDVFNAGDLTMTLAGSATGWHSQPVTGEYCLYVKNGATFDIAAPEGYNLSKIVFFGNSNKTNGLSGEGLTKISDSKYVWNGVASSATFSSSDCWLSSIRVYYTLGTVEDTDYSLDFVDAPTGAAVTIDGTEYTADATWTVGKNLSASSVTNVVEPNGYYAEVSYDADNHKFTVTYKHYYVYNITVTGDNGMGALVCGGEYYVTGNVINSKTALEDSAFSLYDMNGYDESVTVTAVDQYTFNVVGTYTVSAAIEYHIVLVDAPEGAYVEVGSDTFSADGSYSTSYTLSENSFYAVAPEGYWVESSYNAGTHTFTATYHEYLHYTVVVEGTDNQNAGVKYDYNTYYAGDVINTKTDINVYNIVPVDIAGLEGSVEVEGSNVIVTYTKAPYVLYDFTDANVFVDEENGINVTSGGDHSNTRGTNLYGGRTLTVETVLPIEKIVFNGLSGFYSNNTTYVVEAGEDVLGSWVNDNNYESPATWAPQDKCCKVVFTNGGQSDFYISSIQVYLKQPEPTEYTVHFVDAPEGAAATIAGTEYTADATWTVTAFLGLDDVTDIAEVPGFAGEADYTDANHTFTITYTAVPAIKQGTEWTTMALDTPFTLGEGFTPYIVTGVEGGQLTSEEIEPSFGTKVVDFDFENNKVSASGSGFTVEGAPEALTTVCNFGSWSGDIQNGFLFGYSEYGDNIVFSVPEDYEGNITYIEVSPYAGQGVMWKFDEGNFGTTAHYDVNAKSVKVTFGGNYYYYIRHIVVGVEGYDAVVIPAGEGILVNGTTNTNIPYTKKPGATPSDVTGNLLVGCNESATWSEAGKSYYKFSLNAANEAGSEGFYWGVDGGASIEAHAGKAYLVLDTPAASNSRYLINGFGDETLTGLDSVIAPEAAEAIFNLQGQRVNAAKGGVYVKGGKKFIVK